MVFQREAGTLEGKLWRQNRCSVRIIDRNESKRGLWRYGERYGRKGWVEERWGTTPPLLSEIETGRIYSVTPRLSSLVDSRLTSRSSPCSNKNIIHGYTRGFKSFVVRKIWGGGVWAKFVEADCEYIYIYEGRCELSSNDRSIPRILDHGIRDVSMETDGVSTRGKYFRKIFKRHDHFASDIFYLINEQSVLYLLCPWPQEERERENNGADTSTL